MFCIEMVGYDLDLCSVYSWIGVDGRPTTEIGKVRLFGTEADARKYLKRGLGNQSTAYVIAATVDMLKAAGKKN